MVSIYTDGGYSIPKGKGGWGVVVVKDDEVINTFNGVEINSDSNRMELIALLHALSHISLFYVNKSEKFTIYTDSKYVEKGFKRLKSKKRCKGKDSDIWSRISIYNLNNLTVKWIKGKNGNKFNELADSLSKMY